MLRIGTMNMMLHGVDEPKISYLDSLSAKNEERGKYTLIMANPPFTGSVFENSISPDLSALCKTKKTELLFLTLFTKMLNTGGRCASIVPDGVLFGSSKAHQGNSKRACRKPEIGSSNFNALGRVQALRGSFHCDFNFYKNQFRWNG